MLIQILAKLYFIAFLASMFFFVIVDFNSYITELILDNCSLVCSVVEFGKIFFGTLSGILAFILFMKIQVRFLKQLNDNTFGLTPNIKSIFTKREKELFKLYI